MRIAFITPEFVTDYSDGGGLGNYLNRITKLLAARGHEVEVFVTSRLEPRVLDHDGVRVERVPPSRRAWLRLVGQAMHTMGVADDWRRIFSWYAQTVALADAMERRHRESPFALVQSADYLAVGLKVKRRADRVHVVRCSMASDLYDEIDGRRSRADQWRERLERMSMVRADLSYAPSRCIAEHFRARHQIPVQIVRPPLGREAVPAAAVPGGLPDRFLVHFGQFKRRKGTLWLGAALKRAFEIDPTIRMVLIGRGEFGEMGALLAGLGPHRANVQAWYPLPKPELYAVLQRATAAVLPSLVDNLPNTVIESLMLGIPVIGTRGASIDELVEDGVTGALVEPNDVEGLAQAMARVWRGDSPVHKGFEWRGGIADEMQPDVAVDALVALGARANRQASA